MLMRHCGGGGGGTKHRQRKLGMGPVNPNVSIEPTNPCVMLTAEQNQYDPAAVPVCEQYGKICGMPSLLNYVLWFSENNEPEDKASLTQIKSDLADVMVHPNHCALPSQCSTNTDCQPMGTDFGLQCKNIVCKPDDCQPGEECTPSLVCTGACL